jgi:hypothetical protein
MKFYHAYRPKILWNFAMARIPMDNRTPPITYIFRYGAPCTACKNVFTQLASCPFQYSNSVPCSSAQIVHPSLRPSTLTRYPSDSAILPAVRVHANCN